MPNISGYYNKKQKENLLLIYSYYNIIIYILKKIISKR